MKKILTNIKKTKLYYFFLKYFLTPIYGFIWEYIVNFERKIFYIIFKIKNKKNINKLNYQLPAVIQNDSSIKEISDEIKLQIEKNNLEEKYTNLIKSNEYKHEKIKYNKASGDEPFKYNFFYEVSENLKKKIVEFSTSDKTLNYACNYLKVFPIISDISLYINIPTEKKSERASMLWHKDEFGFKSLDIFIAISDIDESNGPLYALSKSDNIDVFKRFESHLNIDNNITGNRGKIEDKNFFNSFNKSDLEKLSGSSGTAMLIDSFRSYHKGGFCLEKNRIMLRFVFTTPDSVRPHNKKILNEISLINNPSFLKKQLFKHDFRFFKIIRLQKILNYFYKLISIPINNER